jgi:hypothetical protein
MDDVLHAELSVYNFNCDPDEITSQIGMQPTTVVRKGDVKHPGTDGVGPLLHTQNWWIRKIKLPPRLNLEECLELSLETLQTYAENISIISRKYSGELAIYGNSRQATRPSLNVDASIVKKLASLGVDLDIDIYPIYEEALDTKAKTQKLVANIEKRGLMSRGDAQSVMETLAQFEIESTRITNDLLPSLAWDILDKEDMKKRLEHVNAGLERVRKLLSKEKE